MKNGITIDAINLLLTQIRLVCTIGNTFTPVGEFACHLRAKRKLTDFNRSYFYPLFFFYFKTR